jgi:hypothetical protein
MKWDIHKEKDIHKVLATVVILYRVSFPQFLFTVPEPPKFVIGLFPDIFTHDYRVEVRNVNESPS